MAGLHRWPSEVNGFIEPACAVETFMQQLGDFLWNRDAYS
jgi:hypothetical protein